MRSGISPLSPALALAPSPVECQFAKLAAQRAHFENLNAPADSILLTQHQVSLGSEGQEEIFRGPKEQFLAALQVKEGEPVAVNVLVNQQPAIGAEQVNPCASDARSLSTSEPVGCRTRI